MGGKARLRDWLMTIFPKKGRIYVEPFCGLGNVTYKAVRDLIFREWYISDIDISFFEALKVANLYNLPLAVPNKEQFNYWRERQDTDPISKLIESRITFAGKGYSAGFKTMNKGAAHYNGIKYRTNLKTARYLLRNVNIIKRSWDEIDYSKLTKDDFVYMDPPYYETKAQYPNIDHDNLVNTLNGMDNTRWALSGYDNELYESKLKYKNKFTKIRNAEIKGSQTRQKEVVMEVVWTNYDV